MKHLISCLVLASAAAACSVDLPQSPACGDAAPSEQAAALSLAIEPASPLDAAPSALRLRVAAADGQVPDPEELHLFSGEIRSGHLSQLSRGEMSGALEERIVPSSAWREDDGTVVVAPHGRLEAGAGYSLATGAPAWAQAIEIAASDDPPVLPLLFPPGGGSPGKLWGVWCGEAPLAAISHELELPPYGLRAALSTGLVAGGGRGCVRLDTHEAHAGAGVPPPALGARAGTLIARLDTVPLHDAELDPAGPPPSCEPDELALLSGCLRIYDDRARLRPGATPRLWNVVGPLELDHTIATEGIPQWIAPLPPNSHFELTFTVLDPAGHAASEKLVTTTLAPQPHLVITEVYADAIGPEPQQEWVEIVNDGLAPANLEEWSFADIGGAAFLPAAELPPGGHALLVREDYDEGFAYDPQPAAGALIVRLPELGKNGLSNSGEPLELRDPQGEVVSRFPPEPKPKSGHSVQRVAPKAPDADPASFVRVEGPSPGAPNDAS